MTLFPPSVGRDHKNKFVFSRKEAILVFKINKRIKGDIKKRNIKYNSLPAVGGEKSQK
jgi:hypothetical protein